MSFLEGSGWKRYQAAAIVGALQQESYKDLRSSVIGDSGKSFGIGQWNGSRLAGLKAYATKLGWDYTLLLVQLKFIEYELDTSERRTRDLLRASTTLEEAVKAFMGYERPTGFTWEDPTKGHGYDHRLANAKALEGSS